MERNLDTIRALKCKEILNHFGFDEQQEKLVEECEELIEAAQSDEYDSFIEELADVSIIIKQMCLSLDPEQYKQYEKMLDFKLDRTIERIKS